MDTRIERTREFLDNLRAIVLDWKEPQIVGTNESDSPIHEWWNGERELTLTFSTERTWALKCWGANMETEMEDITLNTPEDFLPLWEWLWTRACSKK